MFHKHTYHLDRTDSYSGHMVFKFICNGCGHPKTKVVEVGSKFEFEVE